MAVNGEAVQQVQHQHNEHQIVQPPDNAKIQYTPGGEEKACKGADDRRQMRRIGGNDGGNTDIEEQKKSKFCVCGVIK